LFVIIIEGIDRYRRS